MILKHTDERNVTEKDLATKGDTEITTEKKAWETQQTQYTDAKEKSYNERCA